ncbi:MAG TPA: prenyltransferase/squalene oxidase repeat-containing protein [Verrucomicrobiales bacterium]|nr:prenyltransferase/squalene oxidase repeat-containing protein [Verrucomicrobiales bacterium]
MMTRLPSPLALLAVLPLFLTAAWAEPLEPGPAGPETPEHLEAAISRGIHFLLADQNPNGSWGSATSTKGLNIYAPVPGAHHAFRAGVTALCISALMETGAARADPAVESALQRSEDWLLEHLPELRRANPTAIYNVWGHAYGLQALARLHVRAEGNSEKQAAIRDIAEQQIALLGRYESVDGGWGYYDFAVGSKQPAATSTSFVTAAVLVAFHEIQGIGVEIPQRLLDRGIASIHRQRKSDFTYAYGEYLKMTPMRGINRPGGSLGRSQACNIALRLWGDEAVTDEVLAEWLQRLVDRNGWLSIGRKRPVPHEAWFQVAGYFYYFGHYYAALCLEALPQTQAEPFRRQLAGLILPLQETDGSWWDYPLYAYHRPYGTAFALMTLQRCLPAPPND